MGRNENRDKAGGPTHSTEDAGENVSSSPASSVSGESPASAEEREERSRRDTRHESKLGESESGSELDAWRKAEHEIDTGGTEDNAGQ